MNILSIVLQLTILGLLIVLVFHGFNIHVALTLAQ